MIKDHQGDVCVGFEEQAGVVVVRKENSYYPFGLQFPGTMIPSGANSNLYNGGSEWENAFNNLPDLGHHLHLLLIAGRATAKEIDTARSYIAKEIGADDNIGSYWIIIA